MDLKDSLKKVTSKITKNIPELSYERFRLEQNDNLNEYDLGCKIDKFIDWYLKNIAKISDNKKNLNIFAKKIRDFIEKASAWYEIRYPSHEVMLYFSREQSNINEEIFKDNFYMKNDFEFFIQSLSSEEKRFFIKPKYQDLVYLYKNYCYPHFHLTEDGIVNTSEGVKYAYPGLDDKDLVGKHIKEVVYILKNHEKGLSEDNKLEKVIEDYDKNIYYIEELLNCIMYRIIERGGNKIGPRRAFIFAKEFKRNINIPMIYAVDHSDSELRLFINKYIKAGGSKELKCLDDYWPREKKNQKISIITVEQLLRTYSYTLEEQEIHKRIVDILAFRVNEENLTKEKQLKLKKTKIEKI